MYTKEDIIRLVEEEDVEFIRLQFTDLFGNLKNIAITSNHLMKALDNKCSVDSSSISGFIRLEEDDMYLYPDLDTFAIFPWRPQKGKVARLLCDVYSKDRTPFDGDPRYILKKELRKAASKGYQMMVGPELEFFLFHTDEEGNPTTTTHERAGYLDIGPVDQGENIRRDIILTLEEMGFEMESSHHEKAPGQHEVDFRYDSSLSTADNVMTFKLAVKTVAKRNGLHATFMPKPRHGYNGSGMHTNISLRKEFKDVFSDENDPNQLSREGYYFMGGLFAHIEAITAIANPNVNSYKRLVKGYEAPVYRTWSSKNRTSMIRIPAERENSTCLELCSPDPSSNPYLTLAVILAAGLDGIENKIMPPASVDENVFEMTHAERKERGIKRLPATLIEAIEALEKDELIKGVLGEKTADKYIRFKKEEWAQYNEWVSQWEIENYLYKL